MHTNNDKLFYFFVKLQNSLSFLIKLKLER